MGKSETMLLTFKCKLSAPFTLLVLLLHSRNDGILYGLNDWIRIESPQLFYILFSFDSNMIFSLHKFESTSTPRMRLIFCWKSPKNYTHIHFYSPLSVLVVVTPQWATSWYDTICTRYAVLPLRSRKRRCRSHTIRTWIYTYK